MVPAAVLRNECLGPGRYMLCRGLLNGRAAQRSRCISSSKGPPEGDNTESGKRRKKAVNSLHYPWGNIHQRPQRRNRFGPKSQKFFQAATHPLRHYGIRSLNLRLVKDASNVPILIPGRMLKDDESKSSNVTRKDQDEPQHQRRRRRRKLPIVNAAALLDKKTYCRKSAFPGGTVTKSGGEAAKRLLKGKKDLVEMLRGYVVWQQNQRPFCLSGHGIPPQLLQDHINMADSILRNFNEPAECALMSELDENGTDPSSPDSMRIRSQDGQSRNWAWPPQRLLQRSGFNETAELLDISQSWDHSLVLYLAAMDRIAKELGPVGSYFNRDSKKQWTVKMYRGMAYPIEVISRPDDEEDGRPVPILEWSPLNSVNSNKPRVSIRLQGTPNNGKSEKEKDTSPPHPVTLVYDAVFQEDPRVEPIRA